MRELINLNEGWIFVPKGKSKLTAKNVKTKSIEKVTLPHTLNSHSLKTALPPQSVMWYRKELAVDQKYSEKKLSLYFEGVNSHAEIYFNGKKICENDGAYLPITVDITGLVSFSEKNILAVKVSNKDNHKVLPGRNLSDSEHQLFGGIYGGVFLVINEPIYFIKSFLQRESEGGIYVYDETVTRGLAVARTNVEVANGSRKAVNAVVAANVYDRKNNIVNVFSAPAQQIKANESVIVDVISRIENPLFWSPNCPYLYEIEYSLIVDDVVVDSTRIAHGFRTIKRDHRGFILNGEKITLRGVNRTEQFPYIGITTSRYAEYRDAYKIKKAGFNTVRIRNSGASEEFLNACDKLGLMVINCIPTEKYIRAGIFQDAILKTIRQIVKRDRNHTSIVMWEPFVDNVRYSAGGASDKFYNECREVLKSELPYGKPPLVAGDTLGRKRPKELLFDVPYSQKYLGTFEPHLDALPGHKGLVKSYGVAEFGDTASTSTVDRADGEEAMLLQAWNYQWSHNRNRASNYVLGDMLLLSADSIRPCSPKSPVDKNGIMDIYRLPKYSYEFFRSQEQSPLSPMVFIPTTWSNSAINTLPVYSNCQSVKLYINDKFIEEKKADEGDVDEIITHKLKDIKGKKKDIGAFWATSTLFNRVRKIEKKSRKIAAHALSTIYNGKNANSLASPPFTFKNLVFEEGEVRAEGLVDGMVVCSHSVKTPKNAVKIDWKIDYSAKPLCTDGHDFIFCHAYIIDEFNSTVINANNLVTCEVEGGEVVGDVTVQPIAGIASFVVKANSGASEVKVHAISGSLEIAVKQIVVEAVIGYSEESPEILSNDSKNSEVIALQESIYGEKIIAGSDRATEYLPAGSRISSDQLVEGIEYINKEQATGKALFDYYEKSISEIAYESLPQQEDVVIIGEGKTYTKGSFAEKQSVAPGQSSFGTDELGETERISKDKKRKKDKKKDKSEKEIFGDSNATKNEKNNKKFKKKKKSNAKSRETE